MNGCYPALKRRATLMRRKRGSGKLRRVIMTDDDKVRRRARGCSVDLVACRGVATIKELLAKELRQRSEMQACFFLHVESRRGQRRSRKK